jgi:DNA processing protein
VTTKDPLARKQGHGRSSLAERAALVGLLNTRPGERTWPELTALVLERGEIGSVLADLDPTELFASQKQVAARMESLAQVEQWESAEFEFITVLDDRYPERVREIHQAPPFLFARGELLSDDPAVSVVGSRKASDQGLAMAASISRALVKMDVTVLAGLALGIDTAAHCAALDAGGRTVGVIATGIRQEYPAANRELHHRIATEGLLLSQFWPDAHPQKHTFLMRNATMSGYGLATVVVEAGEFSGSRAQARMAVEHGRPVILTDLVVGRTEWGRAMVGRPGVTVVSSVQDVQRVVQQIRSETRRIDMALNRLVAV